MSSPSKPANRIPPESLARLRELLQRRPDLTGVGLAPMAEEATS